MKRLGMLSLIALVGRLALATPYEHVLCDAVDLDGTWEMAYSPWAWETVDLPTFVGVPVKDAVPGYWEDLVPAFRAAGMTDTFRINPVYSRQQLPITGWAWDTTLPDPYGCFFYRRRVELAEAGPARLAFEGVRNQVSVWINGRFVARHAGFSTPFELAVPDGVLRRGPNEIVMAVANTPILGYCGAYVCGLTTRSVFWSTGGVNGHLELRFPKNGLGDVYVTTAADLQSFTVHADGVKHFRYEIADDGKVLVRGEAEGNVCLPTKGFAFWSPESPKRYELRLITPEGTYRQLFGLRRLTADGERLRLNGRFVYLRGVTEHCYFPQTVHVPRDLAYYRMITAKRKELGFNFVRFHTFVPPVEYLEATDELGMLVHVETPNFVSEPEFAEIIAFARRHPSVVIYCTGNETRIDRLAEAYLRDVAELVHTRTDSLFSPMSALRGVEYMLMPGKDVIADQPFQHNPERMARLAEYADVFTSYQLSVTSYETLNNGSAAQLDAWGDAYCGKPRLAHEICINGSYADLSLERLYPPDSPLLKTGLFSGVRAALAKKGLLGRADVYYRHSCEWLWRLRKHCFEKVRASARTVGYDFLGDINTHWHTFGYSVGMMDEFYRLKPGETIRNVRRYNSAAVILNDLGSDFVFASGATKPVAFSLSNYAADVREATLRLRLADASGTVVWEASRACGPLALGEIVPLGTFGVRFPSVDAPQGCRLQAQLEADGLEAENEWETYVFPPAPAPKPGAPVRVIADLSAEELQAAMARGERIVLLGAGPFKSLPTSFQIGLAGRCSGNYATVIKTGHPLFEGLPHEGYCGWQFRRLMEGGRAVQLEADVPFDPLVDIASAVKCPIRQALAFEYRVGPGRLLVAAFAFRDDDPAACWLKARLAAYAASDDFAPKQSLTPAQLDAVIAAPLVSGSRNRNVARNPSDPSSEVRAGEFAQP